MERARLLPTPINNSERPSTLARQVGWDGDDEAFVRFECCRYHSCESDV